MKNSSPTPLFGISAAAQSNHEGVTIHLAPLALGDARLLLAGTVPEGIRRQLASMVRMLTPIEYCGFCSMELPDHERDCPQHPEGPEILPYSDDDPPDWLDDEDYDYDDNEVENFS